MSIYQKLVEVGQKYVPKHKLFKYGFNWSPMYRRSTARITRVSEDLMHAYIRLPISYKNRNYVNSIFGGSMFAAVDPIPMIQLVQLLGKEYIVWDKAADIRFLRPAKEDLYAHFEFTKEELEQIQSGVLNNKETEIEKTTRLTNKDQSTVFCEVHKTIYVADRQYYKQKRLKSKSG